MESWLVSTRQLKLCFALHGEFKGKQILNPNTYKMLITPKFVVDKTRNREIGLSWFLGNFKNKAIITHSGGELGYCSILTLVSQSNTGIVILANYDHTPIETINARVMDIVFEAN
jgi:Beta-lactamase